MACICCSYVDAGVICLSCHLELQVGRMYYNYYYWLQRTTLEVLLILLPCHSSCLASQMGQFSFCHSGSCQLCYGSSGRFFSVEHPTNILWWFLLWCLFLLLGSSVVAVMQVGVHLFELPPLQPFLAYIWQECVFPDAGSSPCRSEQRCCSYHCFELVAPYATQTTVLTAIQSVW